MATRKTTRNLGMTKTVATKPLFTCPVCDTSVTGVMLLTLAPDQYDPDANTIQVKPAGLRVTHSCMPKGVRVTQPVTESEAKQNGGE